MKDGLHILRNPFGISQDTVREARQWAADEIERLTRELSEARNDASAVRELMNVYNLGGWTDAVAPMKRALAAERERDELAGEVERMRGGLTQARFCIETHGHYFAGDAEFTLNVINAALKPAKPDDGTAKT